MGLNPESIIHRAIGEAITTTVNMEEVSSRDPLARLLPRGRVVSALAPGQGWNNVRHRNGQLHHLHGAGKSQQRSVGDHQRLYDHRGVHITCVIGEWDHDLDPVHDPVPHFGYNDLIALLQEHHVVITVLPSSSGGSDFWLNNLLFLGPIIKMILLFWWIGRRVTRTQSGLFSFGKSRARFYMGGKTQTTFADVTGVDEAIAKLVENVGFLKDPMRFQKLGGKIHRGILHVGASWRWQNAARQGRS